MLLRPTDIDVSEMIFQQEVDVIDVRKTQESDLNPISDLPSPSHVIMAFAAEDEIGTAFVSLDSSPPSNFTRVKRAKRIVEVRQRLQP